MPAQDALPQEFETVRSLRLYQHVADQLASRIVNGDFAGGSRLPPEAVLAKRLGVSRPTVREAFIMLETLGLIEVRNGVGAFVRDDRPLEMHAFGTLGGPAVPGPYEQFQAREIIEPGVAALATINATREEVDQLDGLVSVMEQAHRSVEGGTRESFDFHVGLAAASRNAYLEARVRELWLLRDEAMWLTLRKRLLKVPTREMANTYRRRIVEALRRRDGDDARMAMATMLAKVRLVYFPGLETGGDPEG